MTPTTMFRSWKVRTSQPSMVPALTHTCSYAGAEAVQSLRQTQSTFQSVMESYKERFTSTVSRLQQRCDQQAQELQVSDMYASKAAE